MKQKNKENLIHAKGVLDGLRVVYFGNEIANVFSALAHDIGEVIENEDAPESEAEECNA